MIEPELFSAVLLNVDDNEPARYARTRVLRHAGFVVHDTGAGQTALKMIEEINPDLILLDVNLPDMNGIEVCRRIKQGPESAAIIVLQISASAVSAPQAIVALNTGADAYLIEPVDPDVLVATVRAFLRLRWAERGLAKANAELEKTNEALRRSNEDLEHFAYVASHDLQEPLRTISTHLQLLERLTNERFEESERQLFDFVIDASLRMSALIKDLLSYSRIGKEPVHLQPVDLSESLAWAMENLSEAIAGCSAEVTTGDLPEVIGDTLQLSQVFQNLIGNSIKYRSPTGILKVEISAHRDSPAGDWVIKVQDNGIGISKSHSERVFRPFKRLHGREIPGNGIGLAVSRRIIQGHGGTIWVESDEGAGAAFLFTLKPVTAQETSSQAVTL